MNGTPARRLIAFGQVVAAVTPSPDAANKANPIEILTYCRARA
jgi:hypothetical protein